jgi:hypothetical protein
VALLDRTEAGTRPVRLLGVGVHNLSGLDDEAPAPASFADTTAALRRRRRQTVTVAPPSGYRWRYTSAILNA